MSNKTSDLVAALQKLGNHEGESWVTLRESEAAAVWAEIERLKAHASRRRNTLSNELEVALREWKDAGAPAERVVIAVGNLVQAGIDFVIAEFDSDEKVKS